MKSKHYASLMFLGMVLAPILPVRAAGNAAESYLQAFALLDAVPSAELAVLDEPHAAAPTQKVMTFLQKHAQVIELLRAGAKEPVADWGDDGVDMQLMIPQLSSARRASYALGLQCRADLQTNPAAAAEDLLDMMALARHVGQRKVLIAKLVEVGIGAMATERLAENLTSLPEETLKQLPAKLDALPKSSSGAEMMMAEYEFALREVEPQTEGAASKPAAGKANTTKPATTRATTRALFGRAAMVQAMKAFYEAIGEASALPPEEFAKKVDEQMNKFAANPFAAIVAPSFKRSRETFAVAEAKQAMLRAAIDVILSGPDAVAKSRDPFGTGPFEYRETPGGFELKSALATRGKNAVLIVGRK